MTIYHDELRVQAPTPVGEVTLSKLGELSLLFGKNAAGKSLILRAIRDLDPGSVHYIPPERYGSFNFNPNLLQSELTPQGRRSGSTRNIDHHYHERALGRIGSYFMKRGAHEGQLPLTSAARIEQLLSDLIPNIEVRLQPSEPPVVLTRVNEGQLISAVDELSSGEAQMLTLVLDILTIAGIWELEHQGKRILLIDEPDPHVHPDLQLRLARVLKEAAEHFALQTIVATHSISLVAAFSQVWNSSAARILYVKRGQRQLEAYPIDEVRRDLATCLGGHVLMGPLFGVPLLLVEGADDFLIWSQAARHEQVRCAVLPCSGEDIKRYQKRLEEIFASLQDPEEQPAGFALLDGDKPCPEVNPSNPQSFIRYICLACHEAENLYLTDEVLAELGWTWEGAAAEIASRSDDFGEKAERLAKAAEWDRRRVDLKGIIDEVSRILDQKGLRWTMRVGAVLGKSKPSGQLADFLGDDLLKRLWPA